MFFLLVSLWRDGHTQEKPSKTFTDLGQHGASKERSGRWNGVDAMSGGAPERRRIRLDEAPKLEIKRVSSDGSY